MNRTEIMAILVFAAVLAGFWLLALAVRDADVDVNVKHDVSVIVNGGE